MTPLHVSPLSTSAAASESRRHERSVSPSPVILAVPDAQPSRRLLLLERTMLRDGVTPFTSLFTVRVRGDLSEPQLRQALAQLQDRHPLLRCVVQQAAEGPRFVMRRSPAPVPLRILQRTTGLEWETEARREWVTPFAVSSDPLIRMVWLRGDGLHEFMLVAHHCICDGPSGMTLLRDCFAACDRPGRPMHTLDSLQALEDLVPPELLPDRAFRFRVRRRAALLRLALLARFPRRAAPGARPRAEEMYFQRWQLRAVDAAILVERCRLENVTVLAAVGAAFLQAFREVRGKAALRHAYAMVNARRFLSRLPAEALFGIAPGVEVSIRRLPRPGETSVSAFWAGARALRNSLAVRVDRLGAEFYESLVALENLHDRYPRLIADTDAAPAVRHVTFSNMGRLDLPREYSGFRVEHVYSPLVMVAPSPANTVVLSSFSGVMEFALISDQRSLPLAQARAIREKTLAVLCAATGIAPQDRSDLQAASREASAG